MLNSSTTVYIIIPAKLRAKSGKITVNNSLINLYYKLMRELFRVVLPDLARSFASCNDLLIIFLLINTTTRDSISFRCNIPILSKCNICNSLIKYVRSVGYAVARASAARGGF